MISTVRPRRPTQPWFVLPRLMLVLRALAFVVMLAPLSAFAQQPGAAQNPAAAPLGRVEGKVEGHPEADRPVVLLQFRLNAQGEPEGGPIGRTKTGAGGTFVFTDVPIDSSTVYRLGTRIDERLVGSDPFTFPKGETVVQHDLKMPDVQTDRSALGARELLWVAEARTGGLWITEVLHLENTGEATIALEGAPLELPIPSQADELEVLRLDLEGNGHERLGPKLLVSGGIPPGVSVIAFRYRVPAPLGTAEWSGTYALPIAAWRVLSPGGAVKAAGEGLTASPDETYEGITYSVWKREGIEPGAAIAIELSGAPIDQLMLLIPLAGFALLVVGLWVWYLRRRAPKGELAVNSPTAAQAP